MRLNHLKNGNKGNKIVKGRQELLGLLIKLLLQPVHLKGLPKFYLVLSYRLNIPLVLFLVCTILFYFAINEQIIKNGRLVLQYFLHFFRPIPQQSLPSPTITCQALPCPQSEVVVL